METHENNSSLTSFCNLEIFWLDGGRVGIVEAVGSCDDILGAHQASSTKSSQTDGDITLNQCHHPWILMNLNVINPNTLVARFCLLVYVAQKYVIRITRKTFVPFYFLPELAGVKNLSIYFWVPYQVLFLFTEMETELLKLLRLNNFWSE